MTFFFGRRVGSVIQRFIGVWGVQRGIHSRNKKAMEYVAKGWSAIKEVDRVIDYCELNDRRLIPLLRVITTLNESLLCLLVFGKLDLFRFRELKRTLSLLLRLIISTLMLDFGFLSCT